MELYQLCGSYCTLHNPAMMAAAGPMGATNPPTYSSHCNFFKIGVATEPIFRVGHQINTPHATWLIVVSVTRQSI